MKNFIFVTVLLALVFSVSAAFAQDDADLTAIKDYLLENVIALQEQTAQLAQAATDYYAVVEGANFDYTSVWADQQSAIIAALSDARVAWLAASPLYEQAEGIVAGVPVLAEFDVILDAGASGAEDPEGGVPFDLTLADGRVLERPGNLFGILESTLWGTEEDYSSGIWADLNLNNDQEFGELLPDAHVLLAAAEAMDSYSTELVAASTAWEPTVDEAFTALVVMVPTMNEYFAAWRDSRFVSGDEATLSDFIVVSRLADIEDWSFADFALFERFWRNSSPA